MPKVTRRPKRQTGWNETTEFIMRTGHDFFGQHSDERGERDLITLYQAWQDLKTPIMRQWLKDQPGSRPWGWWAFDMQKGTRRECVSGTHPHDDPENDCPQELYFGCPAMLRECDMDLEYESQCDYLMRLKLFTAAEKKLIERTANVANGSPNAKSEIAQDDWPPA